MYDALQMYDVRCTMYDVFRYDVSQCRMLDVDIRFLPAAPPTPGLVISESSQRSGKHDAGKTSYI